MEDIIAQPNGVSETPFLLFKQGEHNAGTLVFPSGTRHVITIMNESPNPAQRFKDFVLGKNIYTPITDGSLEGKWIKLEKNFLSNTEKKLVEKALKTLTANNLLVVESECELLPEDVQALEETFQRGRISPLEKGKSFSFSNNKISIKRNSPEILHPQPSLTDFPSRSEDGTSFPENENFVFVDDSSSSGKATESLAEIQDDDSSQKISPEIEFSDKIPPNDARTLPTLPIFPQLVDRAMREGKASILISLRDQPFRLHLKKEGERCVQATMSEATILDQDLNALVSSKFFTNEEVNQLRDIFDKNIHILYRLASRQFRKKEAGAFYDNLYIQIHLKEDGSITVGFAKKLREGSIKSPQKMAQMGFVNKTYVEAPLKPALSKNFRMNSIMEAERQSLDMFQHPRLVMKRKDMEKDIPVLDVKNKTVSNQLLNGFKSPFYEQTEAVSLTTPPKTKQDILFRLRVARDAAEGLSFIHTKGYVHGDFKPKNIFLSKEDRGIVGDLSPVKEGERLRVFTKAFLDPQNVVEGLKAGQPFGSRTSDVWAFGVSLLEFVYGKDNNFFASDVFNYNGETSLKNIFNELALLFSKNPRYTDINNLLMEIFTVDRSSRPTMQQVLEKLDLIIQKRI